MQFQMSQAQLAAMRNKLQQDQQLMPLQMRQMQMEPRLQRQKLGLEQSQQEMQRQHYAAMQQQGQEENELRKRQLDMQGQYGDLASLAEIVNAAHMSGYNPRVMAMIHAKHPELANMPSREELIKTIPGANELNKLLNK